MKKIFFLVLTALVMCKCGEKQIEETKIITSEGANELIRIKGSETARRIITSIDDFYKKTNAATPAEYSGGGSNLGIMSMMHGDADVIFVSRDLNNEELSFFNEKKFIIDTIAIDGLAIVVNHKNPLKNINMDQLKGIYEGKILTWKELGGPNQPIKVYSRESTSGTYSLFKEKVLSNGNCLATHKSKTYNEDIVDEIKQDYFSIGYVGLGYTLGNELKVLGLLDSLNTNPILPDYASIKSGKYPLKRYIIAIYDEKNEKIKNYISCIHNKNTYRIINESGFIPYRNNQ
jgi:phosphate transport system substrate-binding protein